MVANVSDETVRLVDDDSKHLRREKEKSVVHEEPTDFFLEKGMMKIFLVLLLVGCATAVLHDALEKAVEDAVDSFREALEQTQPLHEALGIEENEFVTRLQSDVRDELIKHIEKLFRDALKKIDEAVRNGKTVNKEAYEKV
ncbi:uncharacterized protein TNIN_202851 [Trichonephila inaurata madagascariensis]|uniref:Uncharacterized protein n=1 Tax=Trichonephila inaurata madagascariensis TaxID=2747483 RepID=A0A8X7CPB1_9ARAC|nr:uncharacterized protein TNIN_202851 [Trichonephila inaurata madagascariensis]